jgi:hypothetical protein
MKKRIKAREAAKKKAEKVSLFSCPFLFGGCTISDTLNSRSYSAHDRPLLPLLSLPSKLALPRPKRNSPPT